MIKVQSSEHAAYQLHMAKTAHKDIVTLVGSRRIPWQDKFPCDDVIFDIYAMMLDRGTKQASKIEIADKLESMGASMNFSMQSRFLIWQVSCLSEDFPAVMQLMRDILLDAVFPDEELQLLKGQLAAQVKEAMTDTEVQADIAIAQQMYDKDHPHYQPSSVDELKQIKALSVADLKMFHERVNAMAPLTCVIVGDMTLTNCESIFADLGFGAQAVQSQDAETVKVKKVNTERKAIKLNDKPSITCVWAYALPFDLASDWFMPTKMAVDILGGGGFSGRLMKTVRDESGLTYRIGSNVRDIEMGFEGYWQMYASFGLNELNEGIKQTEYQQSHWFREGVSDDELSLRKQSLLGQQALSWTKTSAIARSLMYGLMNGYGPNYLEVYPELVKSVQLDDVNKAIKAWGIPDNAFSVFAGSLPDNF